MNCLLPSYKYDTRVLINHLVVGETSSDNVRRIFFDIVDAEKRNNNPLFAECLRRNVEADRSEAISDIRTFLQRGSD